MKRRKFIKGIGLSSAALSTSVALSAADLTQTPSFEPYSYGKPESLQDAVSQEGYILIRIELTQGKEIEKKALMDTLEVKKGKLLRSASFFYDQIWVLWLERYKEDTLITLGKNQVIQFSLGELIKSGEVEGLPDGLKMQGNFLLDKEIGEVEPGSVGIKDTGEKFSFVAMADPQGGLPDDRDKLQTRMKIHNAFIEESVDLVNKLDTDPLFAMVIGDVCDEWGYVKDLAQMNAFLSKMNCPVLYGIGNHETLLRSEFGPGYNMDAFQNFLAAQKAINGLDKLLYSFNIGRWHFIVWPDPLREHFWESHPHYFDWLKRDLEKNKDRRTVVFQHVPSHPIGITPHISYAESVFVKRTFLNTLATHGNVKYLLSGHVHIPLRASFKTAIRYKGIQMISLPAAGYRPRAFGEEDFYGGPSQGIALIHIDGDQLHMQFKTVTEELFDFPKELPEFDATSYALWLRNPWEIPASKTFINPVFEQGLKHWTRRYVFHEDENPSNLCEVRPAPSVDGKNALYLFCRRRGYQAPGQDRLPQDVNRICQAISLEKGEEKILHFSYRIDGGVTDLKGIAGAFCWIEGFSGKEKVFNLMYSAGKIWVNLGGVYKQDNNLQYVQMGLPSDPDQWKEARLNFARDYNSTERAKPFADLECDRILVHFGVWNINDGGEQPFGIFITGLSLSDNSGNPSQVDGIVLRSKPDEDLWWRNKLWPSRNIAGEHRYILATQDPQDP